MAASSATKKSKASASLISAYKPFDYKLKPNTVDGGFFPDTNTIKPFADFTEVHEVLEAITAATEAGVVDQNKWVSQFFCNREKFLEFMEEFSAYDQAFRILDCWYQALFKIAGVYDEEGFVTSEEIVEKLLKQAEESGQIPA